MMLTKSQVESCPTGYPNVAAFLDSDECFSVYRRFGFLQSRLLLNKQAKLRKLEVELECLDEKEAKTDDRHPMTIDVSDEIAEPRTKLLTEIEQEFTSYGMYFFKPVYAAHHAAMVVHVHKRSSQLTVPKQIFLTHQQSWLVSIVRRKPTMTV
jgi:hypothetical protein